MPRGTVDLWSNPLAEAEQHGQARCRAQDAVMVGKDKLRANSLPMPHAGLQRGVAICWTTKIRTME